MLDLTAARVVIQTIILEIFCTNEEKSRDNDNGGENWVNIFTFFYSFGFLSDYQLRLWIAKGFRRAASVNRQMNFSFLLLPPPTSLPYQHCPSHHPRCSCKFHFALLNMLWHYIYSNVRRY